MSQLNLVSGLLWLKTAAVIYRFSTNQAILVLLVGGALIHPLSTLVNRLLRVKASVNIDNKLTSLAMEGTLFMLMTIPVAYGLSRLRPEWFFQGMLLIIGGRYLTFHTLYNNNLYWLIGAGLGLSAYGSYATNTQAMVTTLTGGFIEVCFGIILFYDFSLKKKVA